MKYLSSLLPARNNTFRKDEAGSLSAEAVLAVPFMIWLALGLFSITDAFRTIHAFTMSTYSASDILSRQLETVTPADIEGLNDLHEIVSRASGETSMRATFIMYDENAGHRVEWSYGTTGRTAITNATFSEIADNVPTLGHGESLVLVETWGPYFPIVTYLVGPFEIYQASPSRPRFAPIIAWAGS